MMKIKNLILPLVAILLLILIYFFQGDFLILGGEGNYFLDINSVKDLYRYTWMPYGGTGVVNPLLHFPVGIFDFFSVLQSVGLSSNIISTISVFLIYFLPFMAMYVLLCKYLKINFQISTLISLFYILNPFSTYHLGGLMFWNTAPMFVLPIVFGIIYKYFFDYRKLFICFGIFTLLICFSFANIPYLGIFHIFLVISLIIISYLHKNKFEVKRVLFNFVILELGFMLFNLWWLIPLIKFSLFDLPMAGLKKSAINWAKYAAAGNGLIMNKLFTLRTLIGFKSSDYSFFTKYYNNNPMKLISFIPFIMIILGLLFKKVRNKKENVVILATLFFLLVVFFLNKGVNKPFNNVYALLLEKVPLFFIFRSPLEKFSIPSVFLVSLILAFLLRAQKRLISYFLLGLYLVVFSIPYITLNFISDCKVSANINVSRLFVDKSEYKQIREVLNNEKLNYRILSLPGSLNYQVAMLTHDQKYYTGMNPVLYAINKSFIATYSGEQFNIIYDNISNENFSKIVSLFNINKILLNKDIYPWSGFREKESIPELSEILSEKMDFLKNGSIELYTINTQYFLPHFYIPQNIIYSPNSIETLPDVVSFDDYNIRSATFLADKNTNNTDKEEQIALIGGANEIFVEGKIRDIGYWILDIEGKKENVFYPAIKHHPNNWQWQLALLKEKYYEWKVRKEPEKLIEKKIFYGNKRINELREFYADNADKDAENADKERITLMEMWRKDMEGAVSLLSEVQDEEKRTELAVKIKNNIEDNINRLQITNNSNIIPVPSNKGQVWYKIDKLQIGSKFQVSSSKTIEELKREIDEYIPKFDIGKREYEIEIPRNGNYSLFVDTDNTDETLIARTGIMVDGKEIDSRYWILDTEKEGWIKFGKINLEEGKHNLTLYFNEIPNLLDINKSTNIKNKTDIKYWILDTGYWQEDQWYQVKGKLVEEAEIDQGKIVIEERSKAETETEGEEKETEWQGVKTYQPNENEFTFYFKSGDSSEEGRLLLGNIALEDFEDLSVRPVWEPKVVLRIKAADNTDREQITRRPKIKFIKVNPTKYRIKVGGAIDPYTLVFSESFHKGWKIYTDNADKKRQITLMGMIGKVASKITGLFLKNKGYGEEVASYFDGEIKEGTHQMTFLEPATFETWGKEPIAQDDHLLVNGYANSWYITPEDTGEAENYELIIEFWPQQLFYIGLFISGIILIGCLGYLTYSVIKNRNV